MRTIKFRGKVGDVNEWVYGYLANEEKIYQTEERKGCNCGVGLFRVEPNTVGQFTGLYDKNGKEIYEGDIVKIDGKHIRFIVYSDVLAAFGTMRYINNQQCEMFCELNCEFIGTVEVVGNIYDNHELLEVDE